MTCNYVVYVHKGQGVLSRPKNLNLTRCSKLKPLQSSRSSFPQKQIIIKKLYIKYNRALTKSHVQILFRKIL